MNGTYLAISSRAEDLKFSREIVSGQVSCCYTDGCNKDIDVAKASLLSKDVPSPAQTLQAFKLQPLLEVRCEVTRSRGHEATSLMSLFTIAGQCRHQAGQLSHGSIAQTRLDCFCFQYHNYTTIIVSLLEYSLKSRLHIMNS